MFQSEKIWMFLLGVAVAMLTILDKYSNSILFDSHQDSLPKKVAKVVSLGIIGGFVSLVVGTMYLKFFGNDKEIAFTIAGSAAIFGRDMFYILGNVAKTVLKNKTDFKG